MTTGLQLVDLAATQRGKKYRFGVEVPHDHRSFYATPAWDCSELVEGVCAELGISMPDGAVNQWRATRRISVADAIRMPGALLFAGDGTGSGRDAIHHVAISRGDGHTEEARGTRWGVGTWPAANRFTFGGSIPGVDYDASAQARVTQLPTRPAVTLGDVGRAPEILNWELSAVTGQTMAAPTNRMDWTAVHALQDLGRILGKSWGDCITVTTDMWAALDFLALPLGKMVTS